MEITESVQMELLVNPEIFPDARIIEKNIQARKIQVNPVLISTPIKSVNLGEQESIEFCKQKKKVLICDDKRAITIAQSHSVKIKTSEMILLELLRQNLISDDKFKNSLKKLAYIKSLRTEIVEFFLEQAQNLKKSKYKSRKNKEDLNV